MIINKTKSLRNNKKYLYILGAIIVALVLLFVVFALPKDSPSSQEATTSSPDTDSNTTDPTIQSTKNTDSTKPDDSVSSTDINSPSSDLKTVPIGISFAGVIEDNVEIRAFISEVIEGSGTCTATLTRGSLSVTKSSSAFIDATTSQCEPIEIPRSQFASSGIWTLTVSYKSSDAQGTSQSMEVTL